MHGGSNAHPHYPRASPPQNRAALTHHLRLPRTAATNLYTVAAALVIGGQVSLPQLLPYLTPGAAGFTTEGSCAYVPSSAAAMGRRFEEAAAAMTEAVDGIGSINVKKDDAPSFVPGGSAAGSGALVRSGGGGASGAPGGAPAPPRKALLLASQASGAIAR